MRLFFRSILLFLFLAPFVFAELDSVLAKIEAISPEKDKLAEIVRILESDNDLKLSTSIPLASVGLAIAREAGDDTTIMKLHLLLGNKWLELRNYTNAIDNLNFALKYAGNSGNRRQEIGILSNLGETCRASGQRPLALAYLYSALKKTDDEALKKYRPKICNRLAAVYFEMLINFQPVYAHFDSTDKNARYDSVNKLWIHKLYQDSTLYYASAFPDGGKTPEADFLALSNINILASLYTHTGEYTKAEKLFSRGIRLAERNNQKDNLMELLRNYSNLLARKGQYAQAVNAVLAADTLLEKTGDPIFHLESYDRISKIYTRAGDEENALKYLTKAYLIQTALLRNEYSFELMRQSVDRELEHNEEKLNYEKKTYINSTIGLSFIILLALTIAALQFIRRRELKKANDNLNEKNRIIDSQREELSELNAAKDKFFSIIAHDLKNPMWGVMSYTEILRDDYDELSDKGRIEAVGKIYDTLKGMSKLLENLLAWASYQMKRAKPNPAVHSFKETVKSVAATFETTFLSKNISFSEEIPEDCLVVADEPALYSVVHNLVSNALKFTPQNGSINILLTKEDSFVRIGVRNSGAGVPDAVADKLFKLGEHVTTKGTDGERGAGLGLLLCKEMIEQNGGKIWLENDPGKGATFWFTVLCGRGYKLNVSCENL